jgi:hypothetical protein
VLFVVIVVAFEQIVCHYSTAPSLVFLWAEQRARSALVLGGGEDHKFPLRAKTWMMACPRGEDDHIITLVMEGEVGGSMRRPFEGNRQRKSWSGDIWGKSWSQEGVTSFIHCLFFSLTVHNYKPWLLIQAVQRYNPGGFIQTENYEISGRTEVVCCGCDKTKITNLRQLVRRDESFGRGWHQAEQETRRGSS